MTETIIKALAGALALGWLAWHCWRVWDERREVERVTRILRRQYREDRRLRSQECSKGRRGAGHECEIV